MYRGKLEVIHLSRRRPITLDEARERIDFIPNLVSSTYEFSVCKAMPTKEIQGIAYRWGLRIHIEAWKQADPSRRVARRG